jgi:hypothetical protein
MATVTSSFGLGTVVGPALAPLMLVPWLGLVGPFAGFALFALGVLFALRLYLPNDDPAFAARSPVVVAPFSANSSPNPATAEADEELAEADAASGSPGDLSWFDQRLRPWLVAGLLGGHAQAAVLGIVGFLVLDRLGLRATPQAGAGPTGLVLMAGALATLLAQWGIIPMLQLGPRASCLSGMVCATLGTALLASAHQINSIALGLSLASLGFGLFRPGFTAGTSLAVSRAEQGQAAGIVASVNGAAYIAAPAIGVWLYGWDSWLAFAIIEGLCVAVLVLGWRSMASDPGS